MSLLKKAIALAMKPQPLPPMLTDELELRVEPQVVKVVKNHPAGTTEVLIQWKDLPDFEATWESIDVMKQQLSAIHLEDKVALLGGNIVRLLVKQVYEGRTHGKYKRKSEQQPK